MMASINGDSLPIHAPLESLSNSPLDSPRDPPSDPDSMNQVPSESLADPPLDLLSDRDNMNRLETLFENPEEIPHGKNSWFYECLGLDHDSEWWLKTFHMSRRTFMWLVYRITVGYFECSDMRPVEEVTLQLGITLYYLMSGRGDADVAKTFGMEDISTVSEIVEQMVDAILDALADFVIWPMDMSAQLNLSEGFQKLCNLPNCCGALGFTRFDFQIVDNVRTMTLMAVCDVSGLFLDVHCVHAGSVPNRNVLRSSTLYKDAMKGKILQMTNPPLQPFLLAEESYEPLAWLYCPTSLRGRLDLQVSEEMIASHERGRLCVENAFGNLRRLFRSLDRGISCSISMAPNMVWACCVLMNALRWRNDLQFQEPPISISSSEVTDFCNADKACAGSRSDTDGNDGESKSNA